MKGFCGEVQRSQEDDDANACSSDESLSNRDKKPRLVDLGDVLSKPLFRFPSKAKGSRVAAMVSKQMIGQVPIQIRAWKSFEGYANSLLNRFSTIPVTNDREQENANYGGRVHQMVCVLLSHMMFRMCEIGLVKDNFLTFFASPLPQGGFPDLTIKAYDKLIGLGVFVDYDKELYTKTPPFKQELEGENNFQRSLIKLYNYLIANDGAIYGFICNWNHWVFVRRIIGNNGKETLEITRYIRGEKARKHLIAFLYMAMRHSSQLGKLNKANLPLDYRPGGGQDNLNAQPDNPLKGEPFKPPFFQFKLPQGTTKSSRIGPKDGMEGFFSLSTQIAGVSFTTTRNFLGIDDLVVAYFDRSEMLALTNKSAVYRYRCQKHDIVWRMIDIDGLPKSNSDFGIPQLIFMITTEIKTYVHLKEHQGRLIPRFKYFGHDFGTFWVLVTSYEGISLDKLAKSQGGITQTVKNKTRQTLKELHHLGIIHGDVKLDNILLRNGQDIVWIDFEYSKIGIAADSREAQQELEQLANELGKVPTLPDPTAHESELSESVESLQDDSNERPIKKMKIQLN